MVSLDDGGLHPIGAVKLLTCGHHVVLGLDKSTTARKLVHLLLADPLASAEPWEEQLEQSLEGNGQSIVIRYSNTTITSEQTLI